MKKWLKHEFSSGGVTGSDFKSFSRSFRNALKKQLDDDMIIEKYSLGHYYVSGFIRQNDKYVYFSISDVRHFPNKWFNHILIRTAKNGTDYHGGMNNYTSLNNFGENVRKLFDRQNSVATQYI